MARRLIECVPNFSEGRDRHVVDAIADAIAAVPGVAVLGRTMDPDHNRSVITFAGEPDAVCDAAVRAVGEATARIDLTRHSGVHPRLGAADVVPFVPLEGVTLADCAAIAVDTGERVWSEFRVPVYLYEAAARRPERSRLENVRRGEFEKLRAMADDRAPDIGGPELHPTAGATIVGARHFLIAWNVVLGTSEVAVAKRIARRIRESSGGFPHVKALGFELASRGLAQVSMNTTDFERTPLPVVFDEIRRLGAVEGVEVLEAELIGLLPRGAVRQIEGSALRFANFTPQSVVEDQVDALLR